MARLIWDNIGEKLYETGADHAVLYLLDDQNAYSKGVAWNGLLGFDENPSGAEPTKLWADNINYITLYSAEEYGGTIRAYTYPDDFEECDGSKEIATGVIIGQQARKPFGFCYRTKIGNDTKGDEYGYKLHLVYGCKASPSSKTHDTINDSPAAVEFSWEITSTPVPVTQPEGYDPVAGIAGSKPTCVVEIDSTQVDATKLAELEDILYGKDASGQEAGTVARLPLPGEVAALLA